MRVSNPMVWCMRRRCLQSLAVLLLGYKLSNDQGTTRLIRKDQLRTRRLQRNSQVGRRRKQHDQTLLEHVVLRADRRQLNELQCQPKISGILRRSAQETWHEDSNRGDVPPRILEAAAPIRSAQIRLSRRIF